jgi:hypothetical protein
MSKELEMDLKSAILSTGLLQPVTSLSTKGSNQRIEVLCRQVPGQEGPWLETLTQLLEASEGSGSLFHICRRYILRDGKLVYGWHIQIEGPKAEMKEKVELAKTVLAKANPTLYPAGTTQKLPVQSALPKAAPKRPLAPGQHPPPRAAVPRPPSGEAAVDSPPPNFEFKIRTIEDRIDEGGKRRIVEEIPLPHVYRDLNVPTKPKFSESLGKLVGGQKGATYTGTGS